MATEQRRRDVYLVIGGLAVGLGVPGLPTVLRVVVLVIGALILTALWRGWNLPGLLPAELQQRAIQIANQVKRCDPRHALDAHYKPPSVAGHTAETAEHLEELFAQEDAAITHPAKTQLLQVLRHRRYTPGLHRRVTTVIEEMGKYKTVDQMPVVDVHLAAFAKKRPTPQEYYELSLKLWSAAYKLPSEVH